jgi:hypothetical protein
MPREHVLIMSLATSSIHGVQLAKCIVSVGYSTMYLEWLNIKQYAFETN